MPLAPADFLKWAHHAANKLTHPADPNHDDIVQEGLIAIAAVLAQQTDPSAVFLARRGRWAMMEAAYRGEFTGLPDRRLRSGPPPKYADSLEAMAETPGALTGERSLTREEPGFSRVEWEDLRPDIALALNELQDRDKDYVFDRFYLGHRDAEIGRETGRTTKAVSNRWATVIRPSLRDSLAHLAGAA